MSEKGFMDHLRQGKADADTIGQIGGGIGKLILGLVKIALCVPIMMSYGVDGLLRHSFGSRYFSIMTWLAALLGFAVFAASFVDEDESRAIEIVILALLIAGPAHIVRRFIVARRARLHSWFGGISWIPWSRILFWRIGYWQPLALLDPLVACAIGTVLDLCGFMLGWYFIIGGTTSALRHGYFAWIDHQQRLDQQDAMIEANGAAEEVNTNTELQPTVVSSGAVTWATPEWIGTETAGIGTGWQ